MELTEYKEYIVHKIETGPERELENLKERVGKLLEEYSDETNVSNLNEVNEAKEYIIKMQLNIKNQQENIDAIKLEINSIF